jgi:hypothetical protein
MDVLYNSTFFTMHQHLSRSRQRLPPSPPSITIIIYDLYCVGGGRRSLPMYHLVFALRAAVRGMEPKNRVFL